jgi:hypothetical protein
MTDMQLLLPPLEDGSNEGASRSGDGRSSPSGSSDGTDGHIGANDSRSLLTPHLRESFETMKSIWRHSRRPNSTGNESFDGDDADSLKRKQRELAVETALAVNSEITRLQSGIAELEALLNVPQHHDYDDDDEDDDDGVDEDSFSVENSDADDEPQDYHPDVNPDVPIVLPLVIPVEDDNDDISTDRESDESATEEIDSFRDEDASIASSAPATPTAETVAGAGI